MLVASAPAVESEAITNAVWMTENGPEAASALAETLALALGALDTEEALDVDEALEELKEAATGEDALEDALAELLAELAELDVVVVVVCCP